jgi:putative ABC transport system ATP-binding protein
MTPLIRIDQVSKVYHQQRPDEVLAVTEVSLDIAQGEVVALSGPSGSGKSTLLSLIGCMARPTSGTIFVRERMVSRLPERFLARIRREDFGFVFQHYNLLRDVTALDNVMFPLYPVALPLGEIKARALQLLERFDLIDKRRRKIRELSGGEQQRVALARALIADPAVIIADEPTAHLDGTLTRALLATFEELQAENKTIIIATHDPVVYQASLVGRRVALRHGRISQEPAAEGDR